MLTTSGRLSTVFSTWPGMSLLNRLAETGISFDIALRMNSTVIWESNVYLGFRATRAIYCLTLEVPAKCRRPPVGERSEVGPLTNDLSSSANTVHV